jgi:hypothetical protein
LRGWGLEFKTLFRLASALVLCLSAALTWADECEIALSNFLPKQLRISEDHLRFAAESEARTKQLKSLSNIFSALQQNRGDLNDLARLLRERSASLEVKMAPEEDNYLLLKESVWADRLSDEDLHELASLTQRVPKVENLRLPADSTYAELRKAMFERLGRLTYLLNFPRYRTAIVQILQTPTGKIRYLMALNSVAKGQRFNYDTDPDGFILRLKRNRVASGKFVDLLDVYLVAFAFLINGDPLIPISNPEVPLRNEVVDGLHSYFMHTVPIKTSLDDIADLYDYMMFHTSLPLSGDQLYDSIVEAARTALLTFKGDYTLWLDARRAQSATPALDSSPIELHLRDEFAPKNQFRAPERPTSVAAQSKTPAPLSRDTIPEELALWNFIKEDTPRPLAELRSDVIYQFWYRRESATEFKLRQVQFQQGVLDYFEANPEKAQQLLNALHMGPAGLRGRPGIKHLTAIHSKYYDGPLFEVKILNHARGLMVLVDGVWQFLSVVHKDDVAREAIKLRFPQ